MKIKLSISIVLLISILSIQSCHKQKINEKGVSITLAEKRKEIIDSLHYELFFDIPEKREDSIPGRNIISFHLKKVPPRLLFDFKGSAEDILSVKISGDDIDYEFQNEHILIPSKSLVNGHNEINIEFITGNMSLNRQEDFLYTLFVPDRARTAFPCFDQPDLKATFSLRLEVPSDWTVVANGKKIKEENEDERKSLEFSATKKLPTYLFAFTAGKFEQIERKKKGQKVKLIHRETDTSLINANVDEIFKMVFESLEWMEKYTDIPYPFAKYDLIAIPSFQYGGMEHTGATLYRAERLFLPGSPTNEQLLSRANLIAHETAHMWFGDLVTMEWFNEVWLKEVFANFIADKITRPWFSEFDHNLRFLLAHYPPSYEIDRSEGANPIQQSLHNLEDAGTVYGSIIYHKAPLVMNKLEIITGEEQMREGLKEYLKIYSYDNATWENLIDILDKRTEINLSKWSHVWVEKAGMPEYKTKVSDGNFVITQNDPAQKNRVWPDNFEVLLDDTVSRISIDKNTTAWQHKMDRPMYMNVDGMGYGYFEIAKPADYISDIRENYSDLLSVNRASQWLIVYENMLRNAISPDLLLTLLNEKLKHENNSLIIQQMLDYQRTVFWKFMDHKSRLEAEEKLTGILWDVFQNSEQKNRKAIFNQLVNLSFTKNALDEIYRIWKEGGTKSLSLSDQELMSIAYELLLKYPEKYENLKQAQMDRLENPDREAEFRFISKAIHPDASIRQQFFLGLKEEKNRERESWVVKAVHYLNHPLRQEEEIRNLREYLELLPEIKESGDIFFPKRWLDAVMWGHNSEEAGVIVRGFLKNNPEFPESLELKVKQSADLLFRANEILY